MFVQILEYLGKLKASKKLGEPVRTCDRTCVSGLSNPKRTNQLDSWSSDAIKTQLRIFPASRNFCTFRLMRRFRRKFRPKFHRKVALPDWFRCRGAFPVNRNPNFFFIKKRILENVCFGKFSATRIFWDLCRRQKLAPKQKNKFQKKKKFRIEIFDRISFLVQQIFEFLFEIAHIEKTQHTRIRVVAFNTRIIMIFCRPSLPRTSNRWVRSTIKLFCTVHSLSTARIQVWLESVKTTLLCRDGLLEAK